MSTDRELTAFVRCIGLLDNGSRPSRLRRPPRRSRFRLPQRFPRGSKTSLSRSPDVCPCPRPKRRSPRFRGGTRARSTAREMMSAPKLRWPAPAIACHTKIGAAEARLFRRNSSDQCPRQSAQNPAATATTQKIADGRQQKCDRELIAVAARTPMPQAAAPFVQRFAVKLRAAVRGRSTASTAC
jgi:hypothetical protein